MAYSPSMWSKRFKSAEETMADYFATTKAASTEARRIVSHKLDIPYGPAEKQKIDMYGGGDLPKGSPVFVFVHGGYWVAGCREDSATMVIPLFRAGIITALMGYDLAPSVTLGKMVEEVETGIQFMSDWAEEHLSQIWLCGFSAGAHLVAMALSNMKIKNLGGVILMSGIYDLLPLLDTYVATDADFDKEMALCNSPQSRVERICSSNPAPFLIVTAEHDPPAFRQQSKKFHETLCKFGASSRFLLVEGVDHYSMVTSLQLAEFTLTEVILKMIKNHL